MDNAPLNLGVIGVGLLGGQHAHYAAIHADVTLKAVSDLRPTTGRKIAHQTGATWYKDYHTMLQKEALDMVIVATPDALHRDPLVAAARAGVPHIITEKPLATTPADARRIRDAVLKADATFHILFPNRFNPLDRVVHYAIQNNLIGAPVHGDVRLDDNISVPTAMWGKRSRTWAGGSSTAHFLLSHVVDLLRWYFKPADVVEVYALTQHRVLKYTPDLYDAYLTFDTGLTVRVKAEWIRRMDALVEFELGFSGEKGSLYYRKHPAFRSERGLRLDIDGITNTELSRHQKALNRQGIQSKVISDPQARTPRVLEFYAENNPIDWESALGHYFATLRTGWDAPQLDGFGPLPDLHDALRQVDIVSSIVKSAERRRAIKVPSR
ncbi:MAG: Gfo/Idh/MocA family oxidoreductase [Candidatus Latescibacteria bacterium]|nr:Gfo/Idh/MocA family oxidoreductase [Candidatus Latescibacterota bacterium]